MFRSCGISMNNGITGDNDLNLALDVTAGQMNYSAIANSSTCFIVRAPTASDNMCSSLCLFPSTFWSSMHRGPFVVRLSAWHFTCVGGGAPLSPEEEPITCP